MADILGCLLVGLLLSLPFCKSFCSFGDLVVMLSRQHPFSDVSLLYANIMVAKIVFILGSILATNTRYALLEYAPKGVVTQSFGQRMD